jgi:uroporphyrinogen-III synthase
VCVLRGKQGRNDLIEALRQANVAVSPVAMYDKVEHPQFVADLNTALDSGSVAFYLSSTDQPARVLAAAIDSTKLLVSPMIVSHERIALAAQALGFQSITLNSV